MPVGVFPIGETVMILTVADGDGGFAQDEVIVTVADTAPPEIICSADPAQLWPPNHRMAEVAVIIEASDLCAGAEGIVLRSVTVSSSEPDDMRGLRDGRRTGDTHGADGYTAPVDVTGEFAWDPEKEAFAGTLQLRAERDRCGNGRVYAIEAVVADAAGNEAGTDCPVFVPRGRRPFLLWLLMLIWMSIQHCGG
jgi:hypothetical protein